MDGIALDRYIGRTSYGNAANLEIGVLRFCEVPLERFDLAAGLVVVIPMEGETIVEGRIGDYQEIASIVTPEIFRIIDRHRRIEVNFKPSKKGQRSELLTDLARPGVVSAADSVLGITQNNEEMPLDFRVSICRALVIAK